MAKYFYNPHPQEVEIRGSQIQVYPWSHGEFKIFSKPYYTIVKETELMTL